MTRKRYVKLLMSMGHSRNFANYSAREVMKEGLSYQEDYNGYLEAGLDQRISSADMQRAFRELSEAAGRAAEKMAVVVDALALGIRAFSEAFSGRLNRE